MSSAEQPTPARRFGPLVLTRTWVTVSKRTIRYEPRPHGKYFHVQVAALVGLGLIVLHDGIYRQTQPAGKGDFELWGTISHAGLDMLGQLIFIVSALLLVEAGRIR